MRLTCKMGSRNVKVVEVQSTDALYVLLNKLNISDKNTKFIFNGITYSMGSIQTFQTTMLLMIMVVRLLSTNSQMLLTVLL